MRHVPIELKIRFSPSDVSVGWINSAALISQGEKMGPETLAVTDGKQSVSASFRSVEAGRVYTLFASSALDRRPVGTIDLRNPSGPIALTIDAPTPLNGTVTAQARHVPAQALFRQSVQLRRQRR